MIGCLAMLACEARTPEPSAQHPVKTAPAPAAVSTSPAPANPNELQQLAGVHFLEFVTAGADPAAELPMIIAIHGLGDSPEGFRGLLQGFDQPARVIVPRGLDAHGPGWSWFPIRVSNVSSEDLQELAAGIERAANTLAPMIEQLAATRPTTGKPIVTGFSQGGMLSFTLAIQHPQLLSAALPIGGWLPEPLWPAKAAADTAMIPIIAFHGDADDRVPYPATVTAVDHLKQSGFVVELHSYAGVGHTIPRPMHADLMNALRTNLATPAN
ncbi:Phospholipase/carboxylesterase family protein [Enhygromyxa salina]|uniref:Phospholipase/carboxylesterase family protein n=2 Tax=Enhygromyxa salina TaxID=215803 RepID=A0A0C1ZDV9_9BACT|nr:Phospholipase/carboxylesterase family protein [Enhygromyxa salina]